MGKKMVVSTAILTIVSVNLFLWPYLYKEYKAGQDIMNEQKLTDEKHTDTPSHEVESEVQVDKESNNEDSNENAVNKDELIDETFKVIDIK